ncbi:MAG TPA: IS200/IS605 family transposase [Candidatus Entotheonella sp.]|jgi:putative transposase
MTTVTNNLNHSTWDCKYHVVFTPKYRKKVLYGAIRRDLREVFHRLAKQKECSLESGHLMPDQVQMLIAIPPNHRVATIVGFLKGKSSIWIAQNVANKPRHFVGHKFWARSYFVSTVGANEQVIRAYIEHQEKEDQRLQDLFDRSQVILTASSGS